MTRHNKLLPCTVTSTAVFTVMTLWLALMTPASSASQKCGSLTCENGGQCLDLFQQSNSSSSTTSNIIASGALLLQCLCPPGYGGVTCSYYHGKMCDALKCKYGSCVTNKLLSNITECPCDAAYAISEFAGQMCEDPATEYCDPVWSHEPYQQHFCTNGGRCVGVDAATKTSVREESDTWSTVSSDTPIGCQCPPEFEGAHCEIIIALVSNTAAASETLKSTSSWFKPFLLSFFLTSTFLFAGLLLRWKFIGVHVTPNHGEEMVKEEEQKKESPRSVVADVNKQKPKKLSAELSKGFDFDEMIEIEEDMEEAQFV